jgi:hypothetical protein
MSGAVAFRHPAAFAARVQPHGRAGPPVGPVGGARAAPAGCRCPRRHQGRSA